MTAWTCPRCRKGFDIPEGWETPKLCSECINAGPPKAPVPVMPPVAVDIPSELPGIALVKPAKTGIWAYVAGAVVLIGSWLFIELNTDLESPVEDLKASLERRNQYTSAVKKQHGKPIPELGIMAETDMARIQGTWERSDLPAMQFVFSGHTQIERTKSAITGKIDKGDESQFKLDESKNPKHFFSSGQMGYGIYELDGDTLKIAFASGTQESSRPTTFATGDQTNFKQLCWTLRRLP